jgi:uncharacterized protein (TIGR02300 family)
MTAATASQTNKAMRGTKRVCQACQVRFYDLARAEISCPACGVLYTPVALVAVEARRGTAGSGKTGWRQSFKRASPVLPEAEAPVAAASEDSDVEVEAVGDEVPAADAAPEDDIVLEQEPDDGDVSGLVDVDLEEPKER